MKPGAIALQCALVLAAATIISMALHAAPPADATTVPAWFQQEAARLSQGSGRWLTDNSRYRSEQEPSDTYGVEWHSDAVGTGLDGRLFGNADGKEIAEYWRFTLRWNPGSGQVDVVQTGTGTGAAMGTGTLAGFEAATLMEQKFSLPDGRSWRTLHHAWFENEEHVTRAYDWTRGEWQPGRTYRWHRDIKAQP